MVLMRTEVPGRAGPLTGWICQFKHDEPSTEATFTRFENLRNQAKNAKILGCVYAYGSGASTGAMSLDDIVASVDEIERLRAIETRASGNANCREFINGAAAVLSDLITCYDQPTMATNIIKGLGLEVVDFQDCGDDYKVIRSATNG
jgi:hypothetical protein